MAELAEDDLRPETWVEVAHAGNADELCYDTATGAILRFLHDDDHTIVFAASLDELLERFIALCESSELVAVRAGNRDGIDFAEDEQKRVELPGCLESPGHDDPPVLSDGPLFDPQYAASLDPELAQMLHERGYEVAAEHLPGADALS